MQNFLRKILETSKAKFTVAGYKAVLKLKGGAVLEVYLATEGTSGHYPTLEAKLVDVKQGGELTRNRFSFDDYLRTRTDSRPECKGFYVWENSGTHDWYIAKPSPAEVGKMLDAIVSWAETYC